MTDTATEDQVLDPADRKSATFWFKMIDASYKRREPVNRLSAMFMRWDDGDLADLVDPKATVGGERWRSGVNNKHSTAVTAALADLMFRCPRFVVRSPYVPRRPPPPMPGMPPAPLPPQTQLFTAELARVEEELIRQDLILANYFEKARHSLQDALNADMGILKVTHDSETDVSKEERIAAEEEAQAEIDEFAKGNLKACWARKEQIHSIHLEMKGQYLAMAERREVMLTDAAMKYLRHHLKVHASMKGYEAPTETIRSNSIRIERINPLDYFYDPAPASRFDRTWVGHKFMRRRDEVLADENYAEEARLQLRKCNDRWEMTRSYLPVVATTGSFDLPEDMVMLYEIFDLVDQRRILLADGVEIPLLVEDRGDLAVLQPSGPFHEIVFKQSSMEGQGVPPPKAYMGDFAGAVHVAMSNIAAAVQNQPRNTFDPRRLDAKQVAQAWEAPVGTVSPVEWKGPPDGKVEDAWNQTPACEIHESSMAVKQQCEEGVMTQSGLGVSKMLGGESSPTATGAALGADASGSISDDRGAKIDAWSTSCIRHVARLERYFTPKSQVVQRCGDVARKVWPDDWSLLDASMDVGIDAKAGSARRNNTNVDQEQLLKLLGAVAPLPAMQGPAGQRMVLDVAREFAESAGVTSLQWDDLYAEVDAMAMMRQQAMAGAPPGDGDGSDPESASEDRSDENSPVAQNDLEQGVLNSGGGAGRVGVNESVGQSVVRNREAAQKRVAARV